MLRSCKGCARAAIFGLVASLLVSIPALGQTSEGWERKVDRFLRERTNTPCVQGVDVIATLLEGLSLDKLTVLSLLGAEIKGTLNSGKLVVIRIPQSAISLLANLSWIRSLSEDLPVGKMDEFTVRGSLADAALAQYAVDGRGIGIAVLDSGIADSPDLECRVIASKSFVKNVSSAIDQCGHGTHVAGVIAGSGAASTGNNMIRTFYGIARQANLVNVRVLDSQGSGSVSGLISAIEWVITQKSKFNIRVMNLSLGHEVGESYTTDPLCQAVERAWKAGIVVVTAAGNAGRKNAERTAGMDNDGYGSAYGSITSPGNSPYCITVGATRDVDGIREHDVAASYSGKGPTNIDFVLKPDIVAPGNRVISLRVPGSTFDSEYFSTNTVPVSYFKKNSNDNETRYYFRLSGTSISAPVVSGAAALLLQKDPSLTPDSVKARLMITADKLRNADGGYDLCTYGAGYLNISAALSSTVVATKPAVSPTLSRDTAGNVYIDASTVLWGSHVIWGMNDIYSLSAVWGDYTEPASNDNVIWGSGVLWGSTVWSDNVIWGSDTFYSMKTAFFYGEP